MNVSKRLPMRNAASLFLGMSCIVSAHADCVAVPDQYAEVTISTISAPVYNAEGYELKGCLLHAEGKVLGYATEQGLCQSQPGRSVKVRLSHGCCDTGPDSGDVECIARSKPRVGFGAHGN